jgi:hypothetical protein
MRAASFKSLYQKRPVWLRAAAQRCVAGRSRYSTKTFQDLSEIRTQKWHRYRRSLFRKDFSLKRKAAQIRSTALLYPAVFKR